jgi:signal transduction histidine kinase
VTEHHPAVAASTAPGASRMRFRTWPVVAVALVGLLGLIVVSILAVQRKADIAYAHLDRLNAQYRDIEQRLRRVRADLHLSGILARDYLLDTATPAADYRSRLVAYRTESDRMIIELEPLLRGSDPVRFDRLRTELDEYWRSYAPLFDGTTLVVDRYGFLRREIVPRRDAVMNISAEIEELNNRNLHAQQLAAAERQRELHQYLTRTLAASLAFGVAVAIIAVIRIRVLEGRSEQQHGRTQQAEQELRRLSNQLVRTQEEERKNLSRELHDELGQMLTALRMEIGRSERAQALGSPAFSATMQESKALVDRMMRMVRDLAMGLRPSMLDDLGLEPALAFQAREFSRRYNVPVNLSVDGDLERLPDPQRTCVYRVVQEALTNCAKHAAATEIQVQVVRGRTRLDVSVRDNGVGMESTTGHRGLGLTGIKERVKDINGSTSIQTKPGGGTVVHITLPVPAAESSKENLVANSAR